MQAIKISRVDLRFCRQIREKGKEPRPAIIGFFSEDSRKRVLNAARELHYSRYENVVAVEKSARYTVVNPQL